MSEQEKWALQTRSILTECFRQMRFARAAELAKSCRYLEATVVLSPNGRLPIEPRELDLLARIAARQKQFDKASHLWELALQGSPENQTYKRAIERTVAAKRNYRLRQVIAVNLIAVALAVALLLTFLHLLPWERTGPKNQLKSPSPATVHSPGPEQASPQAGSPSS
jgi:hypothetical protein